jgi:hypothetical protein
MGVPHANVFPADAPVPEDMEVLLMTVRWAFWLASPASPLGECPTRPNSADLFTKEAKSDG